VLMTSLLDATQYPAGPFGDLYHRRWRIEEAFKRNPRDLAFHHKILLAMADRHFDV
jgi:IS4 transposase